MPDARQVTAEAVAAFNAHDEDRIRQTYAADAVYEAPGDVKIEGREACTQYAMGWLNAFPDARIAVHTELVDGDWAAQRFTFEGTHTDVLSGPAGDIPATNRRVVGRGMQVIRAAESVLRPGAAADATRAHARAGCGHRVAPRCRGAWATAGRRGSLRPRSGIRLTRTPWSKGWPPYAPPACGVERTRERSAPPRSGC